MIYFLIPVYNEGPNIEELKKSLEASQADSEKFYLFVDDCSTDNTVKAVHQHFSGTDYTFLEKETNKGPGDSFNNGFEWIIQNSTSDSDIIVTIEGDNTSDLSILPNMIIISELGYDLVLASVYAQGGELVKTSFFRKFLSFFANIILRSVLNLNVLTLSSFYRVYKKSLLQKIKDNNETIISENGFLSMIEILIKAVKSGAKIIEVPTTLLSEKRKGKSKMKIYKTLVDYLRLIFKSYKFTRN